MHQTGMKWAGDNDGFGETHVRREHGIPKHASTNENKVPISEEEAYDIA